jgi:hypothetical protein
MIDRRTATLHAPFGRLGTSSLLRILGEKGETVITSLEPFCAGQMDKQMDGNLHDFSKGNQDVDAFLTRPAAQRGREFKSSPNRKNR